jgi:hypothetical protein
LIVATWFKLPRFLSRKKSRLGELDDEFREKMLAVIPVDFQNTPSEPADCPGLNLGELLSLTHELEQLGFELCADRKMRWQGEETDRGFQRILIHPAESCFAAAIATTHGLERGDRLVIAFYAPLEQDWWVGGTNGKLTRTKFFFRSSKHPLIVRPTVGPRELFSSVLELRSKIARDLGIRARKDLSLAILDDWSRSHLRELRTLIQRRSFAEELVEANKVAAQAEWQWLGDYADTGSHPRK